MIKKSKKFLKERSIGFMGSISGITGFLGSYQVCHSLCMSIIALLGILGIAVAGMPLLFLTQIAVPVWMASVVLLMITTVIYFRKRCISNKLIVFNSGIIAVGTPFFQQFSLVFWSVGGALVALSLSMFFRDKITGGKKYGK